MKGGVEGTPPNAAGINPSIVVVNTLDNFVVVVSSID
jgi:hypothetical protein